VCVVCICVFQLFVMIGSLYTIPTPHSVLRMYPPLPLPDQVGVLTSPPPTATPLHLVHSQGCRGKFISIVNRLASHLTPRHSHLSTNTPQASLQCFLVVVCVWCVNFWFHRWISALIAVHFKMWSLCLIWLLGPAFLPSVAAMSLTRAFGSLPSRGTTTFLILSHVLTVILSVAHAYQTSVVHSLQIYLDPAAEVTLHCWQDTKRTPLSPTDLHFINLDESQWNVNWQNASKQKVVSGTENAINYCIAPIEYKGQGPHCTEYNLWAACHTKHTYCGEEVATSCNWQSPSNTVSLRVLNSDAAEFYAEHEELEEKYWRQALDLVVPQGVDDPPPVLVTYDAELSRSALLKLEEESVSQDETISHMSWLCYGFVVMVYACQQARLVGTPPVTKP